MEDVMYKTSNLIESIRTSIMFKLFIIGFILLVLMIPKEMIEDVIHERKSNRDYVVTEIGETWGGAQYLFGPLVVIPYDFYYFVKEKEGKKEVTRKYKKTKYLYVVPDDMKITGNVETKKKYRGIYTVDVYDADLEVDGIFTIDTEILNEHEVNTEDVHFDKAEILFGLQNLKGLKNKIEFSWNRVKGEFNAPASKAVEYSSVVFNSVNSAVDFQTETANTFSIKLKSAGSGGLYFMPIGDTNTITLRSDYPSPKFDGAYLPDESEVTDEGFTAAYTVHDYYKSFPKVWIDSTYEINKNWFGFDLFVSVDEYQKSTRSIKYAVLFITLLFTAFFFMFELVYKKRIHPIQYFFSGSLLILFYLLLLSLSEHVSFNVSYAIASTSVITVTFIYTLGILSRIKPAVIISLLLGSIFTFLFVTLQLEDYSLLAGSVGLFVILSIIMLSTRKLDWYKLKIKDEEAAALS
jgi:inner membrane protein